MEWSHANRGMSLLLALLLTVLMLAPAAAEQTEIDLQPLLAWAEGMETQTLPQEEAELPDSVMRQAANASQFADAANTDTSVNWDMVYVRTSVPDKVTFSQLCTVLMIEKRTVLLATDSSIYRNMENLFSEDLEEAIRENSEIYLSNSNDGFIKLIINSVTFSQSLPMMYMFLKFDEGTDLGSQSVSEPDGSVQHCVGYYIKNDSEGMIITVDDLVPEDDLRSTLKSGEPFLYGSPVFSADQERYYRPAIGIQASDGYVYSASKVFRDIGARAKEEIYGTTKPESTATPKPAEQQTEKPLEEPTVEPTVTEAPSPEVTKGASEGTGEEPTAQPNTEPKPDSGISGLLGDDQNVYWVAGAAVAILLIYYLRRRGKKRSGTENANSGSKGKTVEGFGTPQAGATVNVAERDAGVTMKMTDQEDIPAGEPEPRVSIRCLSGTLSGAEFPLNGKTWIGRDPRRCGIIYQESEPGISAVHCSVEPSSDGTELILMDEGSSNGTFAGDYRLQQGRPVRLRNGGEFHLASEKNTFQVRIVPAGEKE